MPILQSRFLAALRAADDVVSAHTAHHNALRETIAIHRTGALTAAGTLASRRDASVDDLRRALATLMSAYNALAEQAATSPQVLVESLLVLERERTHFLLRKTSNDRAKLAMRLRRDEVAGSDAERDGDLRAAWNDAASCAPAPARSAVKAQAHEAHKAQTASPRDRASPPCNSRDFDDTAAPHDDAM